jgi:hypothetical protein
MTHLPTAATDALLAEYFFGAERMAIAELRARIRSRKMRPAATRSMSQLQHRSRSVSDADFRDLESQRVFDAAARVVARELGREAGREWFDLMARKGQDDRDG